jgi:putative heme iron utilization protein
MAIDPRRADEARTLMRSAASGVLSTHSVAIPGYPFGSVTPFVLQDDGSAVILISAIAQHTANIRANPKVSLMVRQEATEDGEAVADAQAVGRVTLIGDAHEVAPERLEEASEKYLLFFPDSRSHFDVHDFAFYVIEPVRVRYIGGFGAIYWIERDTWRPEVPDWKMGTRGIIDHMNEDHADAQLAMCTAFRNDASTNAEMLTVDPAGFHVRTARAIHYFAFEQSCATSDAVRREMVRLARAARATTSGDLEA